MIDIANKHVTLSEVTPKKKKKNVPFQDIVLDFSPGPILAVDGDKALNSRVSYTILSGAPCFSFEISKY